MTSKKGGKRQSGNPANRSNPTSTPAPTRQLTGRQKFERASAPVILYLARLPRWAFPLLMAILLIAGLMVSSGIVGGLLLVLLVLTLIWLTALSWPALSLTGRILRVVTIAAAVAVAYARFTGKL